MNLPDPKAYPNVAKLTGEVLALWPEHARYLEKSFADRDAGFLRHSERLSGMIIALSATVYNDKPFMTRYMNGLLLSDVLWVNHCRGLQHYADVFLKGLKPGADLL